MSLLLGVLTKPVFGSVTVGRKYGFPLPFLLSNVDGIEALNKCRPCIRWRCLKVTCVCSFIKNNLFLVSYRRTTKRIKLTIANRITNKIDTATIVISVLLNHP